MQLRYHQQPLFFSVRKQTDATGVTVDSIGNAYVAGYGVSGLDGVTITGNVGYFLMKHDVSGVRQYTKLI